MDSAHIAQLVVRGLHAVVRVHQRQIVDFTPGRPQAPAKTGRGGAKGQPHSRWVRAQGDADQVVIGHKPKSKPKWMTAAEYAALPEELLVRELRYRIEKSGFRTSEITLVTTLLDPAVYPAEALADLYYRRWQVEIDHPHYVRNYILYQREQSGYGWSFGVAGAGTVVPQAA